MSKQIGPEQKAHLRKLSRERMKLERLQGAFEEQLAVVHGLIADGFEPPLEISGLKLAESGGLSPPRVYQIRDEARERRASGQKAPAH